MSCNFVELTVSDNRKDDKEVTVLLNLYHISSVSKNLYTKKTIIRMHNGTGFEVDETYETVKEVLGGKFNACK